MINWSIEKETLAEYSQLKTTMLGKINHLLCFLFSVHCEVPVSEKPDVCICSNAEAVPVFQLVCGEELIKTHTFGACWTTTGETQDCDGENYLRINYGAGRTAWVQESLMNNSVPQEKCSGPDGNCSKVIFVSREEWGARPPRGETKFDPPMSMVFVHHSAMAPCFNEENCKVMMRRIQDLHMDGNGWDDIGYNFLVGEDGRVYEGRGWENQGAQAQGHNHYSYGICIMGTYTSILPNAVSQQAVRDMIDCGIEEGYVTLGHEEFGHRDGRCTECPGNAFYPVLQSWPQYSHREIPVYC